MDEELMPALHAVADTCSADEAPLLPDTSQPPKCFRVSPLGRNRLSNWYYLAWLWLLSRIAGCNQDCTYGTAI